MKISAAIIAATLALCPLAAQSPAPSATQGAAQRAGQGATELLASIDSRREIPDMSFELRITSFEAGRQKDFNVLWGFVKTSAADNKVLVSFEEPASVKGRKMLMDGNIVYYLFPRTRNPIRLSPLQVLLGETSNGDVARTGFSKDYDVRELSEADREGTPCYLFALDAKESKKDATYRSVKLWVEKASLRPQYAEFFAADGKLLKRAFYKDYREAEGKDLPFLLDIYDGDDPQKHTTMAYTKIGRKPVPDTVFRRDYLEAWTPEPPR